MLLVDEKERKNGNDPEKELVDSGFHDYRRPSVAFTVCSVLSYAYWNLWFKHLLYATEFTIIILFFFFITNVFDQWWATLACDGLLSVSK